VRLWGELKHKKECKKGDTHARLTIRNVTTPLTQAWRSADVPECRCLPAQQWSMVRLVG